jgi:hypothetical protein
MSVRFGIYEILFPLNVEMSQTHVSPVVLAVNHDFGAHLVQPAAQACADSFL